MREISFDIETFDTASTAVLVQIGAVVFEDGEILERWKRQVEVEDQIRRGRTISWSTLKFWLEQSDAARFSITADEPERLSGRSRTPVQSVLIEFKSLATHYQVERYHAKGRMDGDVLDSLYAQHSMTPPWSFRQPRDMRSTLDFDYSGNAANLERKGEAHDALADAIHQFEQIMVVRNEVLDALARPARG